MDLQVHCIIYLRALLSWFSYHTHIHCLGIAAFGGLSHAASHQTRKLNECALSANWKCCVRSANTDYRPCRAVTEDCQEWVMGNVVNVKWQSDRYIQIGPGARPSCLMSTGRSFCVELSNGSLKVTGHLHVMLRSRKYGAVPPSSLLSLQRVVRTRQDKVSFTSHPVAQTSFCSVLHAWTVDLLSLSFIIT